MNMRDTEAIRTSSGRADISDSTRYCFFAMGKAVELAVSSYVKNYKTMQRVRKERKKLFKNKNRDHWEQIRLNVLTCQINRFEEDEAFLFHGNDLEVFLESMRVLSGKDIHTSRVLRERIWELIRTGQNMREVVR